jgi:hypothetical protein
MGIIKPYHQGELDSLCGIYSILNSYRIVCNPDENKTQILFNDIVNYFSKKRLLKSILIDGMGFKEMNMVMKDVVYGYMPNYKLSWASFQNPTTRNFWNSMKNHLEDANSCVILGMTGRESHWSVGISATSKTMRLIDAEWKFLKYNLCSTTVIDDKLYVLYPAQTYFISNKEF